MDGRTEGGRIPASDEELASYYRLRADDIDLALRQSLPPNYAPSAKWFDLDRLSPYADLLLVAGYMLVVAGLVCWSWALALIAAGAGLIELSKMLGDVA